MPELMINGHRIAPDSPTYFIADISANHDGDLERAKQLITLAKEAGADAAKFQHFRAEYIVSDVGFAALGGQVSHQAKWRRSVVDVYRAASLPWEWTPLLKTHADQVGIDFFTAPYDLEAVDAVDPYVPAYKIGSGDITWPEILEKIASKQKPVILATGASSMEDVVRAVECLLKINPLVSLLQCNTNYTGQLDNFNHMHLRTLMTFQKRFPGLVLGLSDHTPGHAAVLGAVALGGRIIEKHFTDDNHREGPDHPFSMNPTSWKEMVLRTRELESSLGSVDKFVADNEKETVVIQRRCLRAARDLPAGTVLHRDDLHVLRPAPSNAFFPYEMDQVIGRRLVRALRAGEAIPRKGAMA